jgi:hypothetical protein
LDQYKKLKNSGELKREAGNKRGISSNTPILYADRFNQAKELATLDDLRVAKFFNNGRLV